MIPISVYIPMNSSFLSLCSTNITNLPKFVPITKLNCKVWKIHCNVPVIFFNPNVKIIRKSSYYIVSSSFNAQLKCWITTVDDLLIINFELSILKTKNKVKKFRRRLPDVTTDLMLLNRNKIIMIINIFNMPIVSNIYFNNIKHFLI